MSEKFENTENMENIENTENLEAVKAQITDGELEQIAGGGLGYNPYKPPKFNIYCPFCKNTHGVELAGNGPFQIEGQTPIKYKCTNQGRFFLTIRKNGHFSYYTGNGGFIETK